MGQTWNGDLLHDGANVASDIAGFLSGPPGDPGRIRQVANEIEALRHQFDVDRRALDEAVDELMRTWTGDGAAAFAHKWHDGGGKTAPAQLLSGATAQLDRFVRQLRDYADQLEHAQHEHWMQMGIMAALTVVNVAQLGLDPATDAAEVGMGAAATVGSTLTVADIGAFTVEGAAFGFTSDAIGQLGADALDVADGNFDQTGDHVVSPFSPQELALTTLAGGAGGALLGGSARFVGGNLGRNSDATLDVSQEGATSELAFPGGLGANDGFGGHVLAHVGLDEAALADRGLPEASTFFDRSTAEGALSDLQFANRADIESWLSGARAGARRAFAATFDSPVGAVRYQTTGESADGFSAIAVLQAEPRSPLGYYLVTGYVAR